LKKKGVDAEQIERIIKYQHKANEKKVEEIDITGDLNTTFSEFRKRFNLDRVKKGKSKL
jgi:hypothetical protein